MFKVVPTLHKWVWQTGFAIFYLLFIKSALTALQNTDYIFRNELVSNLLVGSTSCLHNITISEDPNQEKTEIFSVQASFTAGGNFLSITSYVHIIDNDGMHLTFYGHQY